MNVEAANDVLVHSESNNSATEHSFITLTNVGKFLKFFECLFSKKFATKSMPQCPPHLSCVAVLPCETLKFDRFDYSIKNPT